MEQKLTEQQIAQVFVMYLGQQCTYDSNAWNEKDNIAVPERAARLTGVTMDGVETTYLKPKKDRGHVSHGDLIGFKGHNNLLDMHFKLTLKSLSAISDEDAVQVCLIETLLSAVSDNRDDPKVKEWAKRQMAGLRLGYQSYQYLIQQGYALPLFIEPNHPLNGQTPIELGIAIEQPQ